MPIGRQATPFSRYPVIPPSDRRAKQRREFRRETGTFARRCLATPSPFLRCVTFGLTTLMHHVSIANLHDNRRALLLCVFARHASTYVHLGGDLVPCSADATYRGNEVQRTRQEHGERRGRGGEESPLSTPVVVAFIKKPNRPLPSPRSLFPFNPRAASSGSNTSSPNDVSLPPPPRFPPQRPPRHRNDAFVIAFRLIAAPWSV